MTGPRIGGNPGGTAPIPLQRVAPLQATSGALETGEGSDPVNGNSSTHRQRLWRHYSGRLWLVGDVLYSTMFAALEASELSMKEMLEAKAEDRDDLTLNWRKEKQSELKYVGLTV